MRHLREPLTKIAMAAGLLLAAACSGATGPSEPSFRFFTREVFGFPSRAPSVEVTSGDVLLTGILLVPTTEYAVIGQLDRPVPGTLNVTVRASKARSGVGVEARHYYAATVANLPSGDYNVRLIYIIQRNPVVSSLVFQQAVTIH